MKHRPLKIFIALILASTAANAGLYAQTVLVHTVSVNDESDENAKLYNQSAEAGIMDVLFETGCIAFSEMSDADDSGILKLAFKTGSDFILDWKLVGSELKGSLVDVTDNEPVKTVSVDKSDLKVEYKTPQDLYAALGGSLCKSLVGDIW